jgi:hypothetical protein
MTRALDLRPLVIAALEGFSEEFYGKPFGELPESERAILTQNLLRASQRVHGEQKNPERAALAQGVER